MYKKILPALLILIYLASGCGLSEDKIGSATVSIPVVEVTCDVYSECDSIDFEDINMRAYWVIDPDVVCDGKDLSAGNYYLFGDATISSTDCDEDTETCTQTIESWFNKSGSSNEILEWDYFLCVAIDYDGDGQFGNIGDYMAGLSVTVSKDTEDQSVDDFGDVEDRFYDY